MKLITLLLLAFRLVDATSDNATKLESDQVGSSLITFLLIQRKQFTLLSLPYYIEG